MSVYNGQMYDEIKEKRPTNLSGLRFSNGRGVADGFEYVRIRGLMQRRMLGTVDGLDGARGSTGTAGTRDAFRRRSGGWFVVCVLEDDLAGGASHRRRLLVDDVGCCLWMLLVDVG